MKAWEKFKVQHKKISGAIMETASVIYLIETTMSVIGINLYKVIKFF